jgi:hypothetical protein
MKVTGNDITRLAEIVSIANLAGIEGLVFQQDGLASGLNPDRSCALITQKAPNFGQKLGITRVGTFKNRLNLLLNLKDLVLDAKEHERGEISQLDFSAGKTKMSYRASASSMIKAPKEIDDETVGICTIKLAQWNVIVQAVKSMGAKQICIILKDDGEVVFEAADEATTDRFSISVDAPLEILSDNFESAVHYIPTDMLTTIARAATPSGAEELAFSIGAGGTIKMMVDDCEMSIFAQINSED